MAASPGPRCRASRCAARRSSRASRSSPWKPSANIQRPICRACSGRAATRGRSAPSTPVWPGWDVTQRFLFENVLAEEGAPRIIPFGVKMVGPVIYTFGNDEQKERFLPGIRSSDVQWCQGYSEPGAGSDLANLRTRAVREGDLYIVNGQKTWTSFAHWADWI